MTRYIKKLSFGFSPRISNFYRKFRKFDNGIPIYEMILTKDSRIEHIAITKNPAHGIYANYVTEINDGKDDVINIPDANSNECDITYLFYKPKKYNKIEQIIYKWRHKKPIFVESSDYERVPINLNGFVAYIRSKDHLEKGKGHIHFIQISEKINVRIDFDGNYLSTVKGYYGLNSKGKKVLKRKIVPFLKNKYEKFSTGKEFLIKKWNETNPHAPLT